MSKSSQKRKIVVFANDCHMLVNFRLSLMIDLKQHYDEVYAMSPVGSSEHEEIIKENGIKLIPVMLKRNGINPLSDLFLFFNLVFLFLKIRPSVVLLFSIKPNIYGAIAAWVARVPQRVCFITGAGYVFLSDGSFRHKLVRIFTFILYSISFLCATSIFFQNKDDMREFGEVFKIDPSKISLINGSGVDLDHFTYSPPDFKNCITFLFIGRLLRDKGVGEFIQAAKAVKATASFYNVKFMLLGAIDSNPSAFQREDVERWEKEGIVNYIGTTNDVRPFLKKATVFVLPSYREGTPRSALEALSIGRPIITTDAIGCRETVINGWNGLLVPVKDYKALSDAMLSMCEAGDKLVDMGINGRELAEKKFDVKKVNADIISVLFSGE